MSALNVEENATNEDLTEESASINDDASDDDLSKNKEADTQTD
jgi:hypothetical protein